jgi:hypothetical protein
MILEKGQLEVIAGEISNALAHLGNFESMISTEMNVRFKSWNFFFLISIESFL